jgi:hypothetical protein
MDARKSTTSWSFVRRRTARGVCGALLLVTGLFAGVASATAEENGATQWPIGVQTIAPALLPPPGGTEYFDYTLFYRAYELTNSNGGKLVPNFHLDILGKASRLDHTWNVALDAINFTSGVILTGDYQNVRIGNASTDTVGFDFLYLTPLYMTYASGPWHLLFGPSVFIPLGPYDVHRLANPTNNYFSFNQELAVTYLPSPRLDVSAETEITVNGTNPATNYHSGADINTDFGINYAAFPSVPKLQLGVGGFFAKQFQDDTVTGHRVGDGFRLEQFGIGPQVVYYFGPATGVALKWQHEFVAQNAPKGNRFWLEFAFPF